MHGLQYNLMECTLVQHVYCNTMDMAVSRTLLVVTRSISVTRDFHSENWVFALDPRSSK